MDEWGEIALVRHVALIRDPRVQGRVRYRLTDLIVMTLCAVIAGADSWVDVAEWCAAHSTWIRERLHLAVPVAPAHDTFGRVFSLLDAQAVQAALQGWLEAITTRLPGEVIAIDGKYLRHSYDTWHEVPMLQVVNVWATQQHVMLAQHPVAVGSSELSAVPRLLEQLLLHGCIVTLDALHTHVALAEQLVSQGADYVLPVKDNQPTLAQDIASLFADGDTQEWQQISHSTYRTVEKGHGRIEIRDCWATDEPAYLAWLDPHGQWPGLRSLVRLRSERRVGEQCSQRERYFITSLAPDAQRLLEAVRAHWGVENQLHWVLDVVFGEDHARMRTGQAAQNFALLRRCALSLIKQDPARGSVRLKRKKAAWDPDYLLPLIGF